MTDLEKVVSHLQILRTWCAVNPDYGMGLDIDDCHKAVEWLDAAIALLRAQEPVKPIIDIRHGKAMWRCGSCSTALQPNQMHAKFCFNCGRAVKWE